MKGKINLLGIIIGILLVSCDNNKEIQISGTVQNMQGKHIIYLQSVNGMFNSQKYDTLKISQDSTFTLSFPAEKYKRLRFFLWGKRELGSIVVSQGHVKINLDGTAGQPMKVNGLDDQETKVTILLDQLNRDVYDLRTRVGDRWNITKDTVASSVSEKLRSDVLAMDKQIKDIDNELYEKAKQDIRMQIMLAFQNQFFASVFRSSENTKKQWIEEWGKMLEFCEIDNLENSFSLAFYDVSEYNVGIKYNIKGDSIPGNIGRNPADLYFYCFMKYKGKNREAAMAQLFLQDELLENNDPAIVALSERFKELYPHSKWMPLVDKAVASNKTFNEVKVREYIHFPDITNIKTFREVIDLYKGKVIFMDIWATWCGSCREEFTYVKSLQDYIKDSGDVVLLYVSIDRSDDEDKWRKMAAQYDLKGEHVLIQKRFEDEFNEMFREQSEALYIPRYVIFDKKGNICFNKAASPKNMDKLKLQLEEAIRSK